MLPIDTLKIDRSFVNRIQASRSFSKDQTSNSIVDTIVLLAHNLNLNVVAEGVELESQLKQLQHYGCEYAQGFLVSRPVPAQAANEIVSDGLNFTPEKKAVNG